MNKKTLLLIPLFFFCLVGTVSAQFDVLEVPAYIDDQLGCGEFVGGLIASTFVLMVTLIPTIILTRGASKLYGLYVLVGLVIISMLTALGWFPIFVTILIIIALSVGLGRMISDALGGLRK